MRLVSLLVFIAVIGVIAVAQETPEYLSDREIVLPDFKLPLAKDMSLDAIKSATPKAMELWIEELSNGATLCSFDTEYTLLLLLINNKLVDIQVKTVRQKSAFGRWFDESVKSLPPESTTYTADSEDENGTQSWHTPYATWVKSPSSKKGFVDYNIAFPIESIRLSDGMIVRTPIFSDSTNAKLIPKEIIFDVPPQPVRSPQPSYPTTARRQNISGKVIVQTYIDVNGKINGWSFLTIEPMGVGFAAEVEKVLSKWKFDPATINGEPVGIWIAIPFSFRLRQ